MCTFLILFNHVCKVHDLNFYGILIFNVKTILNSAWANSAIGLSAAPPWRWRVTGRQTARGGIAPRGELLELALCPRSGEFERQPHQRGPSAGAPPLSSGGKDLFHRLHCKIMKSEFQMFCFWNQCILSCDSHNVLFVQITVKIWNSDVVSDVLIYFWSLVQTPTASGVYMFS